MKNTSLKLDKDLQDLLDLAKKYNLEGNKSKSIDVLLKIIEIKPDHAMAYDALGSLENEVGNKNEAVKYYKKAIECNPKYKEAYYNLGCMEFDLGNSLEAIKNYKKAINLGLEHASVYYNLGLVKIELEDYNSAIEDFNKSIKLKNKTSEGDLFLNYFNRAVCKERLKKYIESLEDYNEAININPRLSNTYFNRGNVKRALGLTSEALKDYTQAINLEPNNKNYINSYVNLVSTNLKNSNTNFHRERMFSYFSFKWLVLGLLIVLAFDYKNWFILLGPVFIYLGVKLRSWAKKGLNSGYINMPTVLADENNLFLISVLVLLLIAIGALITIVALNSIFNS